MKNNTVSSPSLSAAVSTAAMAALLALAPTAGHAAVATFYGYDNNSSALAFSFTPGIGDSNYAAIGGVNMADDQSTRWGTLLSSTYVRGNSGNVRGHDMSEDREVNWTTPVLETIPSGNKGRWQPFDSNGTFDTEYNPSLTTANAGAQPLIAFRGASNLIAMDSEGAIFADADGSISFYNQVNGGLAADYTWTTLSGGPAGSLGDLNTQLTTSILQNYFIGAEDNWMGFLTGADTVEYYRRDNGAYITTADYSTATAGPLGQYTLAQVIDGQAPGCVFVGMDVGPMIMGGVTVPEPSSALLLLGGAGLVAIRRRRKNG